MGAMKDAEKCPGCHRRFAPDDFTDFLLWPHSDSKERLRWHLRCHQDAHHREMNRDRRNNAQRAMDNLNRKE